jgi:hypothetical protein
MRAGILPPVVHVVVTGGTLRRVLSVLRRRDPGAAARGLEDSSAFSVNIVALALYFRFTHGVSYCRVTQLGLHLFAPRIREEALHPMSQRAKRCLGNRVAVILARLHRARIFGSNETSAPRHSANRCQQGSYGNSMSSRHPPCEPILEHDRLRFDPVKRRESCDQT